MSETAKDFWDNAHENKQIRALSGHSLDVHVDHMCVRDKLAEAIDVLCVGIGTGEWINDLLADYPHLNIDAMDISEEAFKSVPDINCMTPDEFYIWGPINKYDLVISLWVSPHMTDTELELQVIGIVQSLTDDGVFALQYSEPIDETDGRLIEFMHSDTAPASVMSAGLFCRTATCMSDMIDAAGGKQILTFNGDITDYGMEREVITHIVRMPT